MELAPHRLEIVVVAGPHYVECPPPMHDSGQFGGRRCRFSRAVDADDSSMTAVAHDAPWPLPWPFLAEYVCTDHRVVGTSSRVSLSCACSTHMTVECRV